MRRVLVCCWCVALAATACVPGAEALEVGALYPTGGSQGPGGIEEYRGVQLAAELANGRDVLAGRSIRLRLEEAESREAAPAAVERLADRGLPLVVGSYGSTISRAATNTANRRGLVFWETGAVGDLGMGAGLGDRTFRITPSGEVLGREAVAFVDGRLGVDGPFAVAFVDDEYGRSVARGAVEQIERADLDLAVEIPYDLREVDFDEVAETVASSGARALVVVAYLADGVEIRRAILRNGVELEAMIGTSSSYCMRAFGEIMRGDAVGVYASDKPSGDHVDASALTPEAAEVLEWARERYRDRYDDEMSAPALAGFAGAWALFAHVLPRAAEHTPEAISAAALRARVPAGGLPNASGLELTSADDPSPGSNLRAASVIWEWVGDRERQIVWPPALAG